MKENIIKLFNCKGQSRVVTLDDTQKRFEETQNGLRLFTAPTKDLKDGDWFEVINAPTHNGVWNEEEQTFEFVPEMWNDDCDKFAIIHRCHKYKDTIVFDCDMGHRDW